MNNQNEGQLSEEKWMKPQSWKPDTRSINLMRVSKKFILQLIIAGGAF